MKLEIKNLKVDYETANGIISALRDVSISIDSGEILGIVGESGSGKSTLGLSIGRLLPEPAARVMGGEILYDSQDLLKIPNWMLRKLRGGDISYVFQEPASSLNPVMTVGAQIIESIQLHTLLRREKARERAIHLCEQVEISDPARRLGSYPHELSGGMKQRVMLAMALAGGPKLIIADEPTTALDVTIEKQIVLLLKKLQIEMSLSMLLISHNIHLVKQLASRLVIMRNGEIAEEGRTSEVLSNPKHDYTNSLISAMPKVKALESQ
jgi:ABC-type dipeptide/oligopeptide/nickel transport system ATPase component